jgi:hypothetical protein
MNYRVIKITDNDNHNNFYLDITRMQDPRIRVGILYSNFMKYVDGTKQHKGVYEVLNSDYSFYCVWRGYLNSYEEARQVKDSLERFYREKLVNYQPREKSNILTFK